MNKMNLKYGLVALVGLGLSANVSAADLTCSDIQFTPEAFEAYEFADQACLDVIERDGGTYAKFTATVSRGTPGTTIYLRFKHADGTQGPRHRSNLPRNYLVMLDNQPVKLSEMVNGQSINIYVGPKYWTSPEMVEEFAEEVVMAEEIVEEVVMEEEMVEEEIEATLPTTAGPLPWLALFGTLFLILGAAMRFSRKR